MSPVPIVTAQDIEDYERVKAAIAFINAHQHEHPDLTTIARHVHLSDYHFQRLFSRWAGVSPKRFLQVLTVEAAKQRLQASQALLQVTLATGLSSPSRLHDWFIHLEAMSPADYRDGGRGLTITYGIHPTRFGWCLIASTERGICNLQFLETPDEQAAVAWLRDQWPAAVLKVDATASQAIRDRLTHLMTGATDRPLSLQVKGTNFQVQVWRALIQLPFGSLATYQSIATAIGQPQANRAVGTAIGRNPIAYVIPCHRVIRSTGQLGGYRWGLPRKAVILSQEAQQVNDDQP